MERPRSAEKEGEVVTGDCCFDSQEKVRQLTECKEALEAAMRQKNRIIDELKRELRELEERTAQ